MVYSFEDLRVVLQREEYLTNQLHLLKARRELMVTVLFRRFLNEKEIEERKLEEIVLELLQK